MKSSFYHFYSAVVPLALGLATASRAADELSRNSPFMPANGPSAPVAVAENTPLELRGIMTLPSGNVYGLFDPVKRQSSWVKLNEPGNDYIVRTFDASNDAITVEFQGRIINLSLKAAKIDALAPGSVPQVVSAPMMNRPGTMPNPQLSPAPVDEVKRLESVAAEVRRRRALRQAAAQPPMPANGATPSSVPVNPPSTTLPR
jgi:hypothetical protein